MRLLQYTPAGSEPVSVADALQACRIDPDANIDALLAAHIESARLQAEHITGRVYREQIRRQILSDWPTLFLELPVDGASAVAISYRSAASPDAWTPLPASVYRWVGLGGNTVIRLAGGQAWPALAAADYLDRVRVDVTATPSPAVPATVRNFILATVSGWVDQPGALADARLQINPLHERLLDGERLWR